MSKGQKERTVLFVAIALVLLLVALSASATTPTATKNSNYRYNTIDIPVLNYHKVDNLNHALSVSPVEFNEQMQYLYDSGYHTITPDQLISYLKYGSALPAKPILITFDDGYLDNFTNAYPILKKYGYTATIFIVSSFIDHDKRFMTWAQIKEMQGDGFVFGSHTANHIPLTQLSPDKALEELTVSRDEIAQHLGEPPRYFAYPTGAYNLAMEDLIRHAGYTAAFTIRYGQVGVNSDLYALERIPIFKGQRTFRSFLIRLNGAPILERLGVIRN